MDNNHVKTIHIPYPYIHIYTYIYIYIHIYTGSSLTTDPNFQRIQVAPPKPAGRIPADSWEVMVASCAQLDFSTCPPVGLFGSQGVRPKGRFCFYSLLFRFAGQWKRGTLKWKLKKNYHHASARMTEVSNKNVWLWRSGKPGRLSNFPNTTQPVAVWREGWRKPNIAFTWPWSTGLGHWKTSIYIYHTLIITYVSLKFLYVFPRHMS